MQFFVTLTVDQLTASPADLQTAMTEFVEKELQAGSFIITGGLSPHGDGVRIGVSPGGVVRDEPRLAVHGFAVVEAASLEEAEEVASRMLRLHQSYVLDWAGSCEVRPVVTHCLP
jgi:hypothetical protein